MLREGQRVKGSTAHIYLVLDGVLRHIPNPDAYNRLFPSPWEFNEVPQSQIDEMERMGPLPTTTCLFRREGSSSAFLVDVDASGALVKRSLGLEGSPSFARYGFDRSKVHVVPAAFDLPLGRAIAEPNYLVEGLRLQGSGPEIYLVLDGCLRHIPNPDTYNRLFASPWRFEKIDEAKLEKLPKGHPLLDGSLLFRFGRTAPVYLLDVDVSGMERTRRHVGDPRTFESFGFVWDKVVSLDEVFREAIPEGREIRIVEG